MKSSSLSLSLSTDHQQTATQMDNTLRLLWVVKGFLHEAARNAQRADI